MTTVTKQRVSPQFQRLVEVMNSFPLRYDETEVGTDSDAYAKREYGRGYFEGIIDTMMLMGATEADIRFMLATFTSNSPECERETLERFQRWSETK